MDPQQRPCGLPICENTTFHKPRRRPLLLNALHNVVICGRIWWGKPSSNVVSELVSYDGI